MTVIADGKVIIEIDAEERGFLEKLQALGSAAESLTGGALQDLDRWLSDNQISTQAWSQMVCNATNTVVNSFSLLDTSLGLDLHSMAANLESNILAYSTWNANLKTLMDAAVQTGSQAAVNFVLYMQEMGVGAADQIQQMVDNIDYTMQTFPPLMEQAVGAGMTGVYTQVENGKQGVSYAAAGLMDGAVSVISGADLGGAAATASAGIGQGLAGQAGSIRAAGQSLIGGLTTLWNGAAGQFQAAGQLAGSRICAGLLSEKSHLTAVSDSLSTGAVSAFTQAGERFHAAGSGAAQKIAAGIAASQGQVVSAAASAASAAHGAVTGLGWYSLGYNIASGIASGVRGGSSLITSAARSAANSALASAKAALGIHSPSRVFRDEIGKMIPAGIALGIESATPRAGQAATVSAEALLTAAREAVRPTAAPAQQSYVTQNTVYRQGGTERLQLTVPLTVDGREFARATAKYTGRQMAYLEV